VQKIHQGILVCRKRAQEIYAVNSKLFLFTEEC
jgi:hypothetical protein